MKKIIELLKSLWNIYGGIILSSIIAWITDFSKGSMDTATSFLVLTLTCVSVLTFLKITIFKKKPNGIIDKASLNQSSIKAMKTAVNPQSVGEELGGVIVSTVEIIKKGRKFKSMNWIKKAFKWMWAYRQQIIGLLWTFAYTCFIVYCYICDKFEGSWLFSQLPNNTTWHLIAKIVIGCIAVVFVYFDVRNQVKWVGVGSLTKANEYLKQLQSGVVSQLSPDARKKIKSALAIAKVNLKNANGLLMACKTKFDKAKGEYDAQIEFYNTLVSVSADNSVIVDAKTKANILQSELSKISSELAKCQSTVDTYQKQVESYEEALSK